MSITDKILARAKELGLSQAALEKRAGFPKGRIRRWKTGQIKPTLEDLERVAGCLGVTAAFLVRRDDVAAITADDRKVIEGIIAVLGAEESLRRLTLADRPRLDLPDLVTPPSIPPARRSRPQYETNNHND